jgi:phenylalanyl-tRNA synthetase beta chain
MGLVFKGTKECDIAEDIGIAFGYNNIPRVFPPTNTVGK